MTIDNDNDQPDPRRRAAATEMTADEALAAGLLIADDHCLISA